MQGNGDGRLRWRRYPQTKPEGRRPGFGKFELDGRIVISGVCPDAEINTQICERFNGVDEPEKVGKGFWSPFPCPKCHAEATAVTNNTHNTRGEIVRKRRCRMCEYEFITTESVTGRVRKK